MSTAPAIPPSTSLLGTRLREERKRLGLTQVQVAAAVGISAPTQVGYELGHRTPDVNYETAIEALGFDGRYVRTGVSEARHGEMMAWEHLALAFEIVQRVMQEGDIALGPRETIEATRLVYELSLNDPGGAAHAADRVLRLVVSRP